MPTPLQRDAGELPPIARYNGPASHTLVNACAHETSFWTPMCVSHVTLAFTRLFIPNGPLKLQKTPHTAAHKTPCRGTTLGRRAWSAYSSFNSLLFRSPSSPKRYVTQVHRPAHDRAGNHVCNSMLLCVEPRREPRSEKASASRTNPIDDATSSRRASSAPIQELHPPRPSCLSPPPQERVAGRSQVGPES